MKRILNILILLSATGFSYAQTTLSPTENYIYTKNCLNEDCSKKSETVEYFDDLGRTKQTVHIKASPSGKDVVTPVEYDGFGRILKSYLPIPQPGTQNGIIYTSPLGNAAQAYGTDPYFYSSVKLENAPFNRLLSQKKPGEDFQGYETVYQNEVNAPADVKKYILTTSWLHNATHELVTLSGNYPAGQLLKTSVTNEDGHVTTEFTNGNGQTVLARKAVSSSQDSDTYYIYNKYGQLAYVIPPLAVSEPLNQATLDNLCYQYRYDSKGRQVEKKLPGKGWEYMVYDPLGRLLMSQDANMGASKQWLFSKYDKYGRTVYTGIYTSSQNYGSAGRAAEQAQANAAVQNESMNSGGFEASGVTAYYTNTTYPTAFTKILSISYYDTYPAGSPARPAQVLGKNTIGDSMSQPVNTKNLPTASYVKNIEDDSWTKSFIWYDEKSRAVGTYSLNHLGGYTRTETLPDFAGVPQQTKVYHKRLAGDAEKVITQVFEYDQHNRLKKQWHQVNGSPQELLSENTYNELSQLSNKKTGNSLQSIDYTYNIRGALMKVNDPASQGTKLFAYELKYYSPAGTESGKRTNNIAEVLWRTAGDNVLRKYAYQYDALNRMTAGIYSEPGTSVPENGFYNESAVYDLGGNITSLLRSGKNSLGLKAGIDNLTYDYTGNMLNSVTDSSTDYTGYPDVSGNLIGYDDNGNMKDHKDKGILQIDYNILDLPDYVKFDKTYIPRYDFGGTDFNVTTRYLYRADGTKLRKLYTYGSGKANMQTTTLTDYLDGFQYEAIDKGTKYIFLLKFVPTAEGYYDFEKNKYIYSYADHLGNVRLSYFKNDVGSAEVLEENNYYPFGLKHEGYNLQVGNPSYNYEYSGKELQTETGWSDFGARMYMADIGRWGVIDPLAETTTRVSPYNYALNNPVMFVDPDGRKAMASTEMDENSVGFGNGRGMLSYSGRGDSQSILSFLGRSDEFMMARVDGLGGGGGSSAGTSVTYDQAIAFLYFGNINFSQFGDDITINKNGNVSKIIRNGKPNRFFDESGMQLFFNDPENVDKNSQNKKYNIGDKIYYQIDRKEFLNAISNVSNNNMIISLLIQVRTGSIVIAPSAQILAYSMIAAQSITGDADFSAHYLSRKLDIGNDVYGNDSSYHFRFGSNNTIYSLMDAGNFMWGGWSKFIGLFEHEVLVGSNLNELIGGHLDSKADQRAIFNGRKFMITGK